MLRQCCVATNQILLDDDAAPDRFDGTVENRDKAVTSGLDQPSVMLGNARLDKVPLDPLDAIVRSFLIGFHQAAVGRYIAGDNRSQAARY